MRVPELSADVIHLVTVVYEGLRGADDWPTTSYVDARLAREFGLDLDAVLASAPSGAVVAAAGYTEHSKVQAAIYALRDVGTAEIDLQRFVDLVAYGADRERENRPGPLDAGSVAIGAHEASQIWRDAPEGGDIARILTIAGGEPLFTSLGHGPDDWSITFDRRVRRYHGISSIDDYLALRPDPPERPWVVPPEREPFVFVLMPFDEEWSQNVHDTIEATCSDLRRIFGSLNWQRADDITEPGRITDQIIAAIQRADALIADITGSNPNVLFELGYGDALGKPTIVLNQSLSETPFDIKDWRQIVYRPSNLADLREQLSDFLTGTLRAGGFVPN
jgi:hypothetical protein